MSCVLEILTDEELLLRKKNLEKQLKKIDNELLNRSLLINDTIDTIDTIYEQKKVNIQVDIEEPVKKIIKIKIKKKS